MKNRVRLFLILSSCIVQLTAQSSDRYIRIVGHASRTFSAYMWKANINISEVKASEYRKTDATPMEEVDANFRAVLFSMGVPESAIQLQKINPGKANSGVVRVYQLSLTDLARIQQLMDMVMDGVHLQPGLYSFSPVSHDDEKEMILEAIRDARRKAEELALQIGMNVGKILNIEDTSTGCCGEIRDSKDPTSTQIYHVNVTFKLKR